MPKSAKASGSGKPSKKAKRILIIEDEKPLAHALELKMTHEGYETAVATTGSDGLEKALNGSFDLILLDLILPEMDGFAILKELKAKKSKLPIVIVLSNLGQDEDRKKAEEYGVKNYLIKSNVPLADIVQVVKSAI